VQQEATAYATEAIARAQAANAQAAAADARAQQAEALAVRHASCARPCPARCVLLLCVSRVVARAFVRLWL
jgi:hypothetical protein